MTQAPEVPRSLDHPALHALARLGRVRRQSLWLTGGTLRDLLLGLTPPDWDLSASGDALGLGRALAGELGGRFVPLKEAQATCRVVFGGGYLDLVGLRAPGIRDDLRLRDFTVNALAAPLAGVLAGRPRLIDPTGGRADLRAGLLRPAGPGVLADDPLRVLRAYRLMASHGLKPAPGLPRALAAAAPGLFRVARERIGQEWLKLMAGAQAGPAVLAMEADQVLTRLLPELARGRGMAQNPFHHLDVLGHNLATLERLAWLAGGLGPRLGQVSAATGPRLAAEAAAYLDEPRRRALLMTAALLHDLGKPVTRRDKAPGWASFHRHDLEGARLAEAAVRRLGLGRADAGQVARLVAGHMRPFHLMGAGRRGQLGPRAARRLLVACGPDLAGLFLLGLADTMAGRGPQRPEDAEARLLGLFAWVTELRDRELAQALAAPPLLDGRRLMAGLGLSPGPLVGRLLRALRQAQLDGRIHSADEALAMARRLADAITPRQR